MTKPINSSDDLLSRYRLNAKTDRKGSRLGDETPTSFAYLERAALKQDLEAQLLLVIFHEIGLSDLDEASVDKYYQQVAHAGSPAARYAYARYLTLTKYQSDEAIEWLQKSAEEGFLSAQRSLGIFYLWRDQPQRAAKWLTLAAEAGCMESAMLLVSHVLGASHSTEGTSQLKRWLESAAQAHHPIACQNMGVFCYLGVHGRPDLLAALEWFRLASPNESSAAIAVALILEKDLPDAKNYPNEAFDFWKRAAEAGQPDAMIMLADCYAKGRYVDRDPVLAEEWRKKVDNKNPKLPRSEETMSPEAICAILKTVYLGSTVPVNIGPTFDKNPAERLLLSGLFDGQDVTAIDSWLDRLVAQLPSQRAALDSIRAKSQDADWPESLKWTERAAEAGEVDAQHCYGRLLLQGKSLPLDQAAGLAWVERAAKTSPAAQFFLAGLYRHGLGNIAPDYELAQDWLRKAADQGFRPAQYYLASSEIHPKNLPFDCFSLYRGMAIEGNELAVYHHRLWCRAYFETDSFERMKALEAHAIANAQRGNLQAQLDLGMLYEQLGESAGEKSGRNHNRYYAMAAAAYRLAETHLTGKFRLGMLYLKGLGVTQNDKKAFECIQDASRNWSEIRDYNQEQIPILELPYQLGHLYEQGIGTRANKPLALHWYQIAARNLILKTLEPENNYWKNPEAVAGSD